MQGIKNNLKLNENADNFIDDKDKVHPWRVCPIGKHLVRTHKEKIPPSKKHPEGEIIVRHQHCAKNPSKKDLLSFSEMEFISKTNFKDLQGAPSQSKEFKKIFSKGDKFDLYIRGWVHYWNDIFNQVEPLDPNLIKALVATESSFNEKIDFPTKHIGRVRGLMQITGHTFKILIDHRGELRNHIFHIKPKDLLDPSTNICVGVRWLFRKKETASTKLKRKASWMEAVAAYKSYLGKTPEPKPMQKLRKYYSMLQEEKK